MDFLNQIEAKTGLSLSAISSNVTRFLNNSIIDVINKVKVVNPDGYSRMAVKTEVTIGGSTIIDGDIIAVYGAPIANAGNGSTYRRPASEIPFEISDVAQDSTSIHYQSGYSPAWYRDGRAIGIIPGGGIVLHINIPTTSYDAEEIYSMPIQFIPAIVLGASIQTLELDILGTPGAPLYEPMAYPSLPEFTVSLPDNLSPPTFAWTSTDLINEFSGTDIDATIIRASFPTYTAPSFTPVIISSTLNDMDIPAPPAVPAAATTLLNFSETMPVFEMPAMNIEAFPTFDDLSTVLDPIAIPNKVEVPALIAESYSANTLESLPSPPVYVSPKILGLSKELMESAPPTVDPEAEIADVTDLNDLLSAAWDYIVTEEDTELAGATSSFIGQVLSLYGSAMTDSQNQYNQQVAEYQANIARQVEALKLAQADDVKQKDANWTAATAQYDKVLAKHSADMAHYNAEVQQATNEWQTQNLTYEMAAWNQRTGHNFTEFNNHMTSNKTKFDAEMSTYEKKWLEAVKRSELSSADNAIMIALYDKEMIEYNARVNVVTTEYQQNEVLKVWERYKFDSSQEIANFNAMVTSNMNLFNEQSQVLSTEVSIAQANASSTQAALSAKMSASTELAKNNEAQRLAQELQTWQQELADYQGKVSKYTTEASTEISKYNANMSEVSSKMTDHMNTFNTKLQIFQNEQQIKEKTLGLLKQEYGESVGIALQPKGE